MKQLGLNELDTLALGASILGSGGGGAANYNKLITRHLMEKKGPVSLKTVSELTQEDLVVPIAFMGAPLVGIEKIPSGQEVSGIFTELTQTLKKKPTVLMPAEIGGANAFTPLWAALLLDLPVLDADLIGRAFPELQMSTCTIKGVSPNPAILSDCLGNRTIIQARDSHTVERLARGVAVAMGSRALVAMYLMQGPIAKESVVEGSLSHALLIGHALERARESKQDPALCVTKEANGVKLASGIITDINHRVEAGFLKGILEMTTHDGKSISIHIQNEYLLATSGDEVLACTPDLIMLLEQEKGTPITSSQVQFGTRVSLIALPSPEIWKTDAGLKLVGPNYFNYPVTYRPL